MKTRIELNNCPYEENAIYASLCLCGGSITKNFLTEEKEVFKGNYAFFNVLFNYFRHVLGEEKYHYFTDRVASAVTFISDTRTLIDNLNELLVMLLDNEYEEKIFILAKEDTKKNFSKLYKDEKFRSLNKAFEFSDLNKKFTLEALIHDIENIDFESFRACAERLLISPNICIFISGNVSEINFEELNSGLLDESSGKEALLIGYNYDPYLRQDAHIILPARRDFNMEVLAFSFLNKEVKNPLRRLIAEFYAELLNLGERYICADNMDTALIFPADRLKRYKDEINIPDEDSFSKAKHLLLSKYVSAMKDEPEQFCLAASRMMQVGISIGPYLKIIDELTYEMFKELYEKSDFIVSEAQIVLRKA